MGKVVHGYSKTKLYRIWIDMKKRCYNINSTGYKYYGAKGIKICEEWKNDFLSFQKWMYDNGYLDSAPRGKCTIDRINVNKDYCPENCRIITQKEQCSNRTNNVKITINGVIRTMKQWSDLTGISTTTLHYRYYRGVRGQELIKESK